MNRRENVVVCGGRTYGLRPPDYHVIDPNTFVTIKQTLEQHLRPGDVLWHGGANGADTLAGMAAEQLGFDVVVVPAQWKRFGKRAGPLRNNLLLDLAEPRLVIVFPGGRGTADMKRRSMGRSIQTWEVAP